MPLSWNEIRHKALAFSQHWADAKREDSEAKSFWLDFFEIFGITDKRVVSFEHALKKLPGVSERTDGFVDVFWRGMLLVEHKSRGKNLDAAMDQAMGYLAGIAERDLPQMVLVCDFARFRLCQLASGKTLEFGLEQLHQHIRLFGFLAGYKPQDIAPQDPVNIKAAERMGKLHDALHRSGYQGHDLEVLLVRLLFCLFADGTGIFQPAQSMRALIEERTAVDGSDLGARLSQLFETLNKPHACRQQLLDEQVAAFPYVNGKLFEQLLPMAEFNADMREALLDAAALDWSAISPAIFGSLFQSIMNEQERRHLGAHYTSEENILKLIKPLFLDQLWQEFEQIKNNRNKLFEFHKKLRSLKFFDPACGCGNFLVISYRELRLLELELLRVSYHDSHQVLDVQTMIHINVDQFYGIEIEDFPAQIAQLALWLVDHQMNLLASEQFGGYFARIPLQVSPHIVHGNALTLQWDEVLAPNQCSYILGNPPFVGAKFLDDHQRVDTREVFNGIDNSGLLDLVAAWYVKAARYMAGNHLIRAAFVATNSITQGEQVGVLWSWLLARGIHIHFAHRTFRWSNEARGNAAVHCVIVGFGLENNAKKTIYEYESNTAEPVAIAASNINPYLVDAANVLLPRRQQPINPVPHIGIGNKPIDNGNYLFTTAEKEAFLIREPASAKWFRPWLGAEEFLNGLERWCLWLGDCPPAELRAMPEAMKRVAAVQAFRLQSKSEGTKKIALTPTRFHVENMPEKNYMLIPGISSERRFFIPMGYVDKNVLSSNASFIISDANLLHFGILSSTMHNAWVRVTCGRLESRYRYSAHIVYNNFPWPELAFAAKPTAAEAKASHAIEVAAQAVLAARDQSQSGHKPASLADVYDPLTMPPSLLQAHRQLDRAVDAAYALCGGRKTWLSEAERVAFLFGLYQRHTSLLPPEPALKKRRQPRLSG